MNIYWLNPPLSTRTLYPDLGWMNFKTVCPEYNWLDPIIEWEDYKTLDSLVEHIANQNPDILCISTYIWNFKLCHLVAKTLKELNPKLVVIKGGPQQGYTNTFFDEHPYIDYLCYSTGHGEYFLKPFLEQLTEHGSIVEPDKIPFLIMRGYETSVKQMKFGFEGKSAIEENTEYLLKVKGAANLREQSSAEFFYETTRGCPYSCVYCEWGGGTGTKVSRKSIDVIKKELEILSILGYEEIGIIDANFGILPRDADVLRVVADLRDTYGYPQHVYMYGLAKVKAEKKEKILDVLYETGYMGTSYNMALQSIDDIVLTNIKRTDIALEENLNLARKFKAKGVKEIKVELILGLPGSTVDIFYNEMELYQEFNAWFEPRNIMTVLPDSEFAQKEYKDKYKVKTAEIGTTENEEADTEYVSDSIINEYRSSLLSVVGTYSYSSEDWKEMFFMNRAQRVLGPLIPTDMKASIVLKEQYKSIKTKSWFKPIDNWLTMLVNGELYDRDIILVDGKEPIEEIVRKNLKDIS
ncbi:MAG: B12-binding domain-containing radical SAM protein [Methylophagaceae bacterium]|jgi:putative methyltransferase